MTNEKTIDLIRKLLALAESPNEHEAAAAAAKAQALMLKHKIEVNDLNEPEEEYGMVKYSIATQGRWKAKLLNAVSQTNFTKIVRFTKSRHNNHGSTWAIIGKQGDIEITIYLFEYLKGTVERLSKQYSGLGTHWLTSYREGLVLGIHRKLNGDFIQAQAVSPDAKALVLKEDAGLEKATATFFPRLKTNSAPRQDIDGAARALGYNHGMAVTINKGVQGGAGRVQGLLS